MVWRTMLIGLLLLMSVGFTGAQNNAQSKFAVKVSVTANDDIKGEVESYLKRELRSLGDVEVTDWGYDYVLKVIILEHTYKSSGNKTGQISCAYLGLKKFSVIDFAWKFPKEYHDTVIETTSYLFHGSDTFVLVINRERAELKQLCQQIVAEFDTKLLEPYR